MLSPKTVSRILAGYGLSKVLPVHFSRYFLWDSSELKPFYYSHYNTTLISGPVKFTEEDILPGRKPRLTVDDRNRL